MPEGSPIELDVAVTEEWVTEERTARLSASVTNTGESPRTVKPAYYKGSSAAAGEPGVLLYSLQAPDSPSDYTPAECIEHEEATVDEIWWTTESAPVTELDPGETTSDDLIVVDDRSVDGCFPPGEYRFEQGHDIGGPQSEAELFDWGFTISVTSGATEN